MKYDIDDKARLVLKHIVYIAERTAKQIRATKKLIAFNKRRRR